MYKVDPQVHPEALFKPKQVRENENSLMVL